MAACHSLRRWVPTSRPAPTLHTLTLALTLTPALTLALTLTLALALALALALTYVDFYAGGRLGMGSTAIGSAPRRMST